MGQIGNVNVSHQIWFLVLYNNNFFENFSHRSTVSDSSHIDQIGENWAYGPSEPAM